jgi:hypothetical protein
MNAGEQADLAALPAINPEELHEEERCRASPKKPQTNDPRSVVRKAFGHEGPTPPPRHEAEIIAQARKELRMMRRTNPGKELFLYDTPTARAWWAQERGPRTPGWTWAPSPGPEKR